MLMTSVNGSHATDVLHGRLFSAAVRVVCMKTGAAPIMAQQNNYDHKGS